MADYELEINLARDSDRTVLIRDSVAEANRWGADLYYSAHNNGFTDSSANGYESFIFTSPSQESIAIQNAIHLAQAAVWTAEGRRDRGRKRANFYELKETRMPAILVENDFVTNTADARLLKDSNFKQRIVDATVKAFADFYKLKKKVSEALLKRVFVNDTQVGAFRTNEALIRFVTQLIEENRYDIIIREVK
nr:N-acetylmuramoyl-L-alanine amidase [Candidatus Contubernalis alkalaceticus]